METFDFTQLERFAGSSTSIRRPREFAYFSYDDVHDLHPLSDQSLAYYYPPFFDAPGTRPPLVDLATGFHTFKKRDDSIEEHLEGLLDTLQAHEERLLKLAQNGEVDMEDVRVKADLVSYRGMMTKILIAPFDAFSEFEMNATCYQGTIFLEENGAFKETIRQKESAWQPRRGEAGPDMMQYWGYKFETVSVLPKTWAECTRAEIEARESLVVNNHPQYCSIVRTGIGSTRLVIAGEVDAVLGEKPDNPDDPIPWVELKTTAESQSTHPREAIKYERKLLRYWAQSFLLGVPTIVVGYRSAEGHLLRMQELQTQKIPSQVKLGNHTWDGNLCINFTAAFLDFLRQTVTGDGVWRIARRRDARVIEVFQVEAHGTGKILKPSFKQHRERLRALEISAALGK